MHRSRASGADRKIARTCGWKPLSLLVLAALSACGGDNGIGTAETSTQPVYKAEIRRTSLGVPHIKADDLKGAGYGFAYAQAEDNLCTMADSFLTYRGERSKYFGADALLVARSTIGQPRNIDSDFFHRHLLSADALSKLIAAQPADIRDMVAGFTAGYNRYLRDLKANAGNAHVACRSEPWVTEITPDDIYRRMYAANFGAGYSNFLANIANATPPVAPAATATTASVRRSKPSATQLAALRIQLPELQIGGKEGIGSNAIGYGTAATGSNSPLLFGNPHWYWRGPDRFYQAQLTVPGQLNVSGATFLGIPVVLIGHNDNVAWSHTVSTARRFGFFQLTLASGDPTTYLRDGKPVKMTAVPITVDVKQASGQVTPVSRTLYRTEFGPMVNLALLNPALGWTATTAYAMRDLNEENYRLFRNWLRWNKAKSLDEFIAIQREETAIPWVNTIAVGRGNSKAWYADIGPVPNVSAAQVASCTTPAGQALAAALPRVPFFDGSRSACDWQNDADSVQKGAIGPSRLPGLLRDDYVANMNDSYWSSNPKAPMNGYPSILGAAGAEAPLSMRTRLGHLIAQGRLDGTDGYSGNKATVDTVKQMVLDSRVLTAELFKTRALPVLCAGPSITVSSDPLTREVFSPARTVDVTQACSVLQAWENKGNVASRGAHVWDEFWTRASLLPSAQLYNVPYNAADSINTPRDLKTDAPAALQQAFGAAVLRVQQSGFAENAPRGDTLFATRSGVKIPLFGGCGTSGYFTIACSENRLDKGGYTMDLNPNGNSYMQIVSFPDSGVEAHTFLTFSLSDDPASPYHADYTREYSAKRWVRMPFSEVEISANPDLKTRAISQ
ncbi:penicillin acylase family protein [Noviherbaspirillum saxi]|uniref:Penicillin acylase family protein n=1 Tax=Noviherbaspirillum saxi TaxID=2320863 RepID=A0A3A3FLZ7_9BURK|nr:penicillin acylase family protein [Noviherbaspirillum saxi]RJF92375.1 penicillin acylase family protein [Noviherbaspirillum saxi]